MRYCLVQRFTLLFIMIVVSIWAETTLFAVTGNVPAEYAVIIIIDGCRPEYLKLTTLPNIEEIVKRGVTYDMAWVGQLPTNTPPSHATLGTGVFPARHHVVGFKWVDPETGDSFYPCSITNIRRGTLARVISDAKVPSVFGLYKKFHPESFTLAMSSVKPYAAIPLGNLGADCIIFTPKSKQSKTWGEEGIKTEEVHLFESLPGHELEKKILDQINRKIRPYEHPGDFDTWVVEAFLTIFELKRPTFSMINLPETDEMGHACGGMSSPQTMRPVIKNVDKQLGRIINAFKMAGLFDKTLFVITADHGMVPNSYDISIGGYVHAFWRPKDWFQLGITTPFIWLQNPRQARNVARRIDEIKPVGINHIFYKTPENGQPLYRSASVIKKKALEDAYQYLLKTLACPNSSDLFLFIKENAILGGKFPLNQRGKHYQGTWLTQHIPLIISGPGLRSNHHSHMPARIVDIPPTVLTLMGIEPRDMDGIVLADALCNPPPSQVEIQKRLSKELMRYQRALIEQSQHDLHELDDMRRSASFLYRHRLWIFDGLFLICLSIAFLGVRKTASSPVLKKIILSIFLVVLVVSQILFLIGMRKLLEI